MSEIILTGDWHVGAATTDVDLIKKIAKNYWKDFPVLLMGDIADFGYFRGMQFDQVLQPQEQVIEIEDILSILNIVGYTLGNHEMRVYEQTGLNPYEPILHMKPTTNYRVGNKLIYFNHGKSAAKNIFLEHHHLLEWVDADVIALGHNHALGSVPYLRSNGKIVHLVRTGSFLGRADYSKRNGQAPDLKGWVTYESQKHIIRKWRITEYGKVVEI